jgi:hypothetical protein
MLPSPGTTKKADGVGVLLEIATLDLEDRIGAGVEVAILPEGNGDVVSMSDVATERFTVKLEGQTVVKCVSVTTT